MLQSYAKWIKSAIGNYILFWKKNERGGMKKLQQFEASMISLENVKTDKYLFALSLSTQVKIWF